MFLISFSGQHELWKPTIPYWNKGVPLSQNFKGNECQPGADLLSITFICIVWRFVLLSNLEACNVNIKNKSNKMKQKQTNTYQAERTNKRNILRAYLDDVKVWLYE